MHRKQKQMQKNHMIRKDISGNRKQGKARTILEHNEGTILRQSSEAVSLRKG